MATDLYDKNYARAVSDIFTEKMAIEHKSLEDVANATGVKYNTLYRYLNGTRQIPIDLFGKICHYLNLDFIDTFQLVNKIAVDTTVREYDLLYSVKDVLGHDEDLEKHLK